MRVMLKDTKIGSVLVNAELEVSIGDQGIGSYEFWGFKGVDRQMGIDEIIVKHAEYVADQDEVDLPPMEAREYIELDENQDDLYDAAEQEWLNCGMDEPDDYDPVDDIERDERREQQRMGDKDEEE